MRRPGRRWQSALTGLAGRTSRSKPHSGMHESMSKSRITVTLDPAVAQWVEAESQQRGQSVSAVINRHLRSSIVSASLAGLVQLDESDAAAADLAYLEAAEAEDARRRAAGAA